jgi:hypothetical protein
VLEQELVLMVEVLHFGVKENNWLGEGKKLDFKLDFR